MVTWTDLEQMRIEQVIRDKIEEELKAELCEEPA